MSKWMCNFTCKECMQCIRDQILKLKDIDTELGKNIFIGIHSGIYKLHSMDKSSYRKIIIIENKAIIFSFSMSKASGIFSVLIEKTVLNMYIYEWKPLL